MPSNNPHTNGITPSRVKDPRVGVDVEAYFSKGVMEGSSGPKTRFLWTPHAAEILDVFVSCSCFVALRLDRVRLVILQQCDGTVRARVTEVTGRTCALYHVTYSERPGFLAVRVVSLPPLAHYTSCILLSSSPAWPLFLRSLHSLSSPSTLFLEGQDSPRRAQAPRSDIHE